MYYYSLLFVFFLACPGPVHTPDKSQVTKVDHSNWDTLLKKYVDTDGNVNYKSFAENTLALDTYLDGLATNPIAENAAKNERLAYYINLYNAATIKLILDNYPVKSIKSIKRPWGKEWESG